MRLRLLLLVMPMRCC